VSAPRRILVRAPTWVGDAVMATPALRALRAGFPEAEISLEGRGELRELFGGLPHADRFLVDPGRGARALAQRVAALRRERFELALLLPDSVRAALAPRLAGIPQRIGYARDPLRRALLTREVETPRAGGRRLPRPTAARYRGLVRALGCPDRGLELELVVDPRGRERMRRRLAGLGVAADEDVLLVAPGAAFGPSKRWPPGHFAAACDLLARRRGLRPVLVPAPGEAGIARAVAERTREGAVALLDPPLGLGELVALVERAHLVLSNDTGPRHVAAALGVPAVVLVGPTDPRHAETPGAASRVLRRELPCSPCQLRVCPIDHRCMTGLAPALAVEAAEELLA